MAFNTLQQQQQQCNETKQRRERHTILGRHIARCATRRCHHRSLHTNTHIYTSQWDIRWSCCDCHVPAPQSLTNQSQQCRSKQMLISMISISYYYYYNQHTSLTSSLDRNYIHHINKTFTNKHIKHKTRNKLPINFLVSSHDAQCFDCVNIGWHSTPKHMHA